jgi:hypothetical protein
MRNVVQLYDIYGPPLGALIAFFGAYAAFGWRPVHLLARTTYRTSRFSGYPRSIWRVVRFISLGVGRKVTFDAACLWVELGLLDPRPDRPERLDYPSPEKFREARRGYRAKKHAWAVEAKSKLKTLVENRDRDTAIIDVDTCFDLYRAETGIKQYLTAKSAARGHKPVRFDAKVHVSEGFVAPLYLLGGLLAHFEDDWQKVIGDYGNAVDAGMPELGADVLALQAFLFRCWLLWGPSIPIGTCKHWRGLELLQFGYGDENNSIILKGREGDPITTGHLFTSVGARAVAVQATVVGNIELSTAIDKRKVCSAQQSVVEDPSGRIVLAATEVEALGGTRASVSRLYYSAYLWVAFVICGSDGKPLHDDRWRNLLTFFEHGNIAEPSTCRTLKHQLAAKVWSSLESILDQEQDITLHYGCAIDDSGCEQPIAVPTPGGQAIKDILFNHDTRHRLPWRPRMSRRVRATPPLGVNDDYAACQLSEIVDGYLKTINNGTTVQ